MGESASSDPTDILLFMFFGLGIGIMVRQILSRMNTAFPYTVVMFLLGILFSVQNKYKQGTMWDDSIKKWSRIDADLLLFVFLPPLIFGESMSLNWFFVIGGLWQSLILAGPGAFMFAGVMAVIAKVVIPNQWSWLLCLLFGSIVSAKDPVAVVALLKDAGASPKLTVLVVGESLLNDGTAMVMFTLFFNLLAGNSYTAGKVIAFFLKACLGSAVFGVVAGLLMVLWLRTCNRPLKEVDTLLQICITICCSYLVFFIAQKALGGSGALACCTAGSMLAWLAPPLILNHESMHNVWGIIEWIGNTLIFLLAGLIIGTRTLSTVEAHDWWVVIVLYLSLTVLRFVVIGCLYPWLSSIGHKCSPAEGVFMSWVGLRGTLSMALALLVENERDDSDTQDQASRLFFYVGGICALTMIVNATSAHYLLFKLGLIGEQSLEQEIITTQIRKRLRRKIGQIIEEIQHEFEPEAVEEMRRSCSLLQDDDSVDHLINEDRDFESLVIAAAADPRILSNSSEGPEIALLGEGNEGAISKSLSQTFSDALSFTAVHGSTKQRTRARSRSVQMLTSLSKARTANGRIIAAILSYVRTIFLEIVRVNYWHQIEMGKVPRLSHSAQFLLYTIDVGLDRVRHDECLQDWSCLEAELDRIPIGLQILIKIEPCMPGTLITRLIGRWQAYREKKAVYMLTAFIDAHLNAQLKMHSYVEFQGDSNSAAPEETKVKGESMAVVEIARKRLNAMPREMVSGIRAKQAAHMLLAREAVIVKEMLREGLLSTKHAEEFLEEISQDTVKIEKERRRMYITQAKRAAADRVVVRESISSQNSSIDGAWTGLIRRFSSNTGEHVEPSDGPHDSPRSSLLPRGTSLTDWGPISVPFKRTNSLI